MQSYTSHNGRPTVSPQAYEVAKSAVIAAVRRLGVPADHSWLNPPPDFIIPKPFPALRQELLASNIIGQIRPAQKRGPLAAVVDRLARLIVFRLHEDEIEPLFPAIQFAKSNQADAELWHGLGHNKIETNTERGNRHQAARASSIIHRNRRRSRR